MSYMQRPMRTIISAALLAMLTHQSANAGSFSLYTESRPAALGNYAAGVAAEAADASTGWYNPAGLALLGVQEAVLGIVAVYPTASITGTSTFTSQGLPPYEQSFSGLNGSKPGYVPSLHYALPLGERAGFGLSLISPFGLSTEWDVLGPVRYAATTSKLLTFNASPEIGGFISDNFAIGAGIDLQYARVTFNSVIGAPALLQAFEVGPRLLDSLSYNKGHSFGVGFHAGIMGVFNDTHTRIGLNYQSQVKHRFHGYSRLHGRLASLGNSLAPSSILKANPDAMFWSNSLASNLIALPDVTTLSFYQDITNRLALLGSVVYTGWNSFKTIELERVAAYAPGQAQTLINVVNTENYRNAWRYALGANYSINTQWMLRVGGGYDQTPTQDLYRDLRVPDSNRWAASIGAHYQAKPNLGFDVGYTHLFSVGNARINKTTEVGSGSQYNVYTEPNAHADLFGIQAVWIIDQPVVSATK